MNTEDQDRVALIFTGPTLLIALLGGGGTWWIMAAGQRATGWLMDHDILVAKEQAMVPILDAGLDGPRIAVIVAVAALVVTLSVTMIRRTVRKRRR